MFVFVDWDVIYDCIWMGKVDVFEDVGGVGFDWGDLVELGLVVFLDKNGLVGENILEVFEV